MPEESPQPLLSCANPFRWLEIHEGGQCFLCCPAWLKTCVGNILTQSPEQIWNGPAAQRLRKGVIGGTFVHCNKKRCPRIAAGTAPVGPAGSLEDPEVAAAAGGGELRLTYGPKILNLCYDRSCNLACPSCRTQAYAAGVQRQGELEAIGERMRELAGPSAEQLRISGTADPFASAHFLRMLETFDPAVWPRLRSIHLHSNGQLWTPRIWARIEAVHALVDSAEISVDAASAETYARNRIGGCFERLLENLEFIASLPLRGKLSFVVQKNNFREIPAFLELAGRLGFNAYLSSLVNWGTFTREEFRSRAVHQLDHPEHQDLVGVLRESALGPGVDLGNLFGLIEGGR